MADVFFIKPLYNLIKDVHTAHFKRVRKLINLFDILKFILYFRAMKNYIRNFGLLFAAVLVFISSQASAQVLSIVHLRLQDTLTSFNSGDSLFITLKNTGNKLFNGPVSLKYHTDSVAIPSSLDTVQYSVTLNPGDSVFLNKSSLTIKNVNFHNFTNIVVIWPFTTVANVICDSAYFSIQIDGMAGISELKKSEPAYFIYPNPSNSVIYLQVLESKYSVENVRIYDNMGSLVKSFRGSIHQIEISELPGGLYTLEIETSGQERTHLSFIKQ